MRVFVVRPDHFFRQNGPAATFKWQGRFLVCLLSLLTITAGLISCTSHQTVHYDYPADLMYNEQVDSLGLSDFLALPGSQRRMRQRMAATWRERAEDAQVLPSEMRALHNAVGLAPDHPESWLRLAHLTRWCGHHLDALRYLRAATASLRFAPLQKREELILQVALLHAWVHYDRGEWRRGLAWSDSSITLKPSDRHAILVRGLLLAGGRRSRDATYVAKEIERKDFFMTDWRWIRGVTEYYRGWLKEAFALMQFSPNPLHRAECWHDRALIEEKAGYGSEAKRHYERAHSSLPLRDRSFLYRYDRSLPGGSGRDAKMPVWVAFNRFYVTGSLLAYTGLALERFETAADAADREFWADATLNAASICILKEIGQPWTRAWRGRVYAQLEMDRLAESDLSRALREFRQMRRSDPGTLAWLGHVKLRQEQYTAALPLLQRAVAADSTRAQAWTDLGFAMIMTDHLEGAMIALDRALTLDPDLAVAWYNRGLMYFHAQHWKEAVADLQEAARLAPDNTDITQVLQRAILMVQRSRIEE